MNDQRTDDDEAMGRLVRSHATRHAAPAALRARVAADLRGQIRAVSRPAARRWSAWLMPAAGFASGVFATLLIGVIVRGAHDSDIDDQIVAAHVRATLAGHSVDVASSDRHEVKPWLSARLDFSPPVHDLRDDGFPLQGGRLDYVSGRRVAALAYLRNRHTIDVFVWPNSDTQSATTPAMAARDGFNAIAWTQAGMRYWVVSDLAADELRVFAEALRKRNATS